MSRLSNGRPLAPRARSRTAKRKNAGTHALNALEVAEKQNPVRTKIRQHRLGEIDGEDNSERALKRRKVERDEDAIEEGGTGSDDDNDPWHVGVDSGDEDSDLDSDEALADSDEERFEGFAFRGSAKKGTQKLKQLKASKKRPHLHDVDLSEERSANSPSDADDDSEDEDDLGEDAVDLATALDSTLR